MMFVDDDSYPLDSEPPASEPDSALPDLDPMPQPSPHRRAFMVGFGAALAAGLLGFVVLLASGALGRLTHAASRRVAGVFHPNRIDVEAAKARLRQAGGADLIFPLAQPRLIVCKEYSELTLFNGDRFVKRYKVALGKAPAGPKERQGDNRTPEGTFSICTHDLPRGAEHLFIGLNFPRTADADAALKAGTITQAQRNAIAAAEQNHQTPPWDTPLGGAVGIHGVGDKEATAGCIGMTDEQAAEIFVATTLGTPVTIEK